MPGQLAESAAIFDWVAREVSRDTYVNIMAQYHPDYEVGELAKDGTRKYAEIGRRPGGSEIDGAYEAARRAGLWRFDERS